MAELEGRFIVIGSYDGQVLGWQVVQGKTWALEPRLSAHGHEQSVRAISGKGHLIVTGSADQTMKIFDLKKRVEEGTLLEHEGIVTCLQFYEDSYLFSASEDGKICIWDCSTWQCSLVMRGHKNGVISLSVHPSGRIALSLSKDKILKMWNLITGKCAFTQRLDQECYRVLWSPDGTHYALLCTKSVEIFSVESKVHSLSHSCKIISLAFISDSLLAVGGEDKKIHIWDFIKGTRLHEFVAHDTRVKDLQMIENGYLASCGSEGTVKIWDVRDASAPQQLAVGSSKARITCMTCTLIEK